MSIFNKPQKYDSAFFSSILEEIQDPIEYDEKIKEVVNILHNSFPGLKLVTLPTCRRVSSFLQGVLLPADIIKELHLTEDEYKDFGLQIFAHIPENFQEIGIRVYDSRRIINWEEIPNNIKHCLRPEGDNHRAICTHHISDINIKNCVIGVLNSAYYLFQEYKKYERTKLFNLDCHPHDYKGAEKNG